MIEKPLLAIERIEQYLLIDKLDMTAQTFLWSLTNLEESGPIRDAGINVYRRMSALGDLLAAHKLATLTGEGVAACKGDPAYAEKIYDDMGTRFEDKLVAHLGYRGPWILRDMLVQFLGLSPSLFSDNLTATLADINHQTPIITSSSSICDTSSFPVVGSWRVLDIGCGSGLVGKVFQAFTRPPTRTQPTIKQSFTVAVAVAVGDMVPTIVSNDSSTQVACSNSDIHQLLQYEISSSPPSIPSTTIPSNNHSNTGSSISNGHLAGIDVSQKMVEITRDTGLYDVVVKGDLLTALCLYRDAKSLTQPPIEPDVKSNSSSSDINSNSSTSSSGSRLYKYHMIIAADTFIYVGDLGSVFQSARYALRSGGLLLFSVEDLDASPLVIPGRVVPTATTSTDARPVQTHSVTVDGEIIGAIPGWGGQLLHSARFAHSHSYIQALADIHEYKIVSRRHEVLRLECTQPQPGIFYILQLNS